MAGFRTVILTKSNNVSSADQAEWVMEETQTAFKRLLSQAMACWWSILAWRVTRKHSDCAA